MTYEARTYVKNGFPPKEATSPAQAVALEFDGYVPVAPAAEQTEEEAALATAEAERLAAEAEAAAKAAAAEANKTEDDGKPSDKVPSPADVAKAAKTEKKD